ncbi:hypothetical protein DESA109040_19800 [Deinococcus saxicola]|uniref:hypothetical protein n=1 Tax=Deinococcus saxicola TaxID=249406 RepID=UPI0039EF6EF9
MSCAQSDRSIFSARGPGLKTHWINQKLPRPQLAYARTTGTKRAAALLIALLTATAAQGETDLKAAALQTAQTLGGVLRDCPSSFAGTGLPEKQCRGMEDARAKLKAALTAELYGVWRSHDKQPTNSAPSRTA